MTDSVKLVMSLHEHQYPELGQTLFTGDAPPGINPQTFYLPIASWEELGSPEVVTITVEPGDLVNVPDDGEEILHRDAVTGQFVTEQYADENPDTTVTEGEQL